MRVLLNLTFLMLWTGFALGSIALAVHLAVRLVRAMRVPSYRAEPAEHVSKPWSRWEKILLAFSILGVAYWTAQWLTYTSHGSKFFFAAGPALAFSVLAGINTVVARRVSSGSRTNGPRPGPAPVQTTG